MSAHPPYPGMQAGMYPPPPSAAPRGRKEYGVFAAMVLAPFFSGSLYRDVARNWRGIGAWYMFLLLTITAIAVLVKVHLGMHAFVKNDFPQVVQTFPPITITDGTVSSPVEQPYVMKDPEKSGEPIFALDTTGKINSLDDTNARVLVTAHKLYMRESDGRSVRQNDLSQIKSFFVDRARLTGWMDTLGSWIGPICLPFLVIFPFLYRLLQALIFAALGLAFAAGFGARLRYDQLMRLSMIAATPAILLSTVLFIAGIDFRFEWFVYGLMTLGYLLVAVKANADESGGAAPGFPVYQPPVYEPPMNRAT